MHSDRIIFHQPAKEQSAVDLKYKKIKTSQYFVYNPKF
jgi:hypothetical protein